MTASPRHRDRDFTNNRALRDYAIAQEIDWFGRAGDGADHRIPIDEKTNVVMQKIPLQNQAPDRMETLAPGVKRYRSSIPSHRSQHRLFALEPGVQAVRAAIERPKFVGGEEMYSVFASDRSWVVTRFARQSKGAPAPQGLDVFTRAAAPGWVELLWENRGRREYESACRPATWRTQHCESNRRATTRRAS